VAERIKLHTAKYGGNARALLIGAMFGWSIIVSCLVIDTMRTGTASDMLNLLGLTLVFGWIFWFQLRERPLAYASATGLDLERAWGSRRHFGWSEIRHIKASSLFGRHFGRRFQVQLAKGSLHFYARSDLPQIVEQFMTKARST
jgi:predicted phage tail protein